MHEIALKLVLNDIAKGEYRRDLFLFDRKTTLELFKEELANASNALSLFPLINSTMNRVTFDGNKSVIVLAVSHPEISYRFAGMPWTAIHGLETLDKYPNTEADKIRFYAQVRRPLP